MNHQDPTYRRVSHAAHTGNGTGWDLEQWDVIQTSYDAPTPAGIPADAERHHGYVDGKVQHVVYSRRAPFSPERCASCPVPK